MQKLIFDVQRFEDVINTDDGVSVAGTAGADNITNSGSNVTINAAAGNDTITNSGSSVTFNYTAGDGDDVIIGMTSNDTLVIDDTGRSNSVSGDDLIITAGEGSITLSGAATLDTVNISVPMEDTAANLDTLLLKKTDEGYPIIAEAIFNPNMDYGPEPTNFADSDTLTITSADGLELKGFYYKPENSNDKWVILIHGYGQKHTALYPFATQYLDNGYNVLMVDQRAAGASAGEWLTLGAAEGEDIARWTQAIAKINSNAKITLHGVSMGAATAILAAAHPNVTNVTSLVEDCGYTNALELANLMSSYGVTGEMVNVMDYVAKNLTGYYIHQADPIDSISSVTLPSLFISGADDIVVPLKMTESLYSASGAETKELFTVKGAGHGDSASIDPVGYANSIFRFNAEADGEGWETSNATDSISLRGTSYNDTITNSGSKVTINAGTGDDTITNSGTGNVYIYNDGDGADVIVGMTASDTLVISSDTVYAKSTRDNDVVVRVGDGTINLQGAASLSALNISGSLASGVSINNTVAGASLTGTLYDDTISNSEADSVTINALDGDDYITNTDADKVYIDAGEGNNTVNTSLYFNWYLTDVYQNNTITAGGGADYVSNRGGYGVDVYSGDGNDTIYNYHSYYSYIDAGNGNDSIVIERGAYQTVDAGAGNDSIIGIRDSVGWGMGGFAELYGGEGDDYIDVSTYVEDSYIDGGEGNDTIIASGPNNSVYGGAGDDFIQNIPYLTNPTDYVYIDGGDGNDTIQNDGSYSEVYGGAGNDSIENSGSNSYIDGGDGDNVISLTADAENNTVTASGNTTIYSASSSGNVYKVSGGNEVISGYNANDTILIENENVSYDTVKSGSNLVITASSGAVTLLNASNITPNIQTAQVTHANVSNTASNTLITGTEFADTITNSGSNVMIDALGGNDSITNTASSVSINAGNGSNTISNSGANVTLEAGSGKDFIENTASNVTINAGAGYNTVSNSGGEGVVYQYAAGETRTDMLIGFTQKDTLLLYGDGYNTVDQGGLMAVTTSSGQIFFRGNDIPTIVEAGVSINNTLDSALVDGTNREDIIRNSGSNVMIYAQEGDDLVTNTDANNVHIDAGEGNNTVISSLNYEVVTLDSGKEELVNYYSDTTIVAGTGNDYIENTGGYNLSIVSGEGNDTIFNTHGYYATINAGAGDDSIVIHKGHYQYIDAGDGNDTIVGTMVGGAGWMMGGHATVIGGAGDDYIDATNANEASIDGGEGNDTILSSGGATYIDGGAGDDSISVSGYNTTINGGAGNDTIYNSATISGNFYVHDSGDDVIIGASKFDSLIIDSDTTYQTIASGNDVSVGVYGSGSVLLKDAVDLGVTIIGTLGEAASISNTDTGITVTGTNYDDTIENSGTNVTINALDGDDIINNSGANAVIISGAGTNDILNSAEGVTIDGSAGVNNIGNEGDNVSIIGGDGNDTITNTASNVSIDAGAGDDSIEVSNSSNSTINAGTGNDTITNTNGGNVYQYTAGDGDDVIIGFTASDTLIIASDTYRTSISGNDQIVSIVASGNTITLKDAASVSAKISGEWYEGNIDLEGNDIEKPVAIIEYNDHIYYYESVARAASDASISSAVTVIANSTETATIDTTKNLAIQFNEAELGVYGVQSGNFLSYGNIDNANFTINSARALSNNGVNFLQIDSGSTATLDGYEVTGTSNGYTFGLQNEPLTYNGVSYNGGGTATFDTTSKVTLTSGAIVADESLATSDTGIALEAGVYTLNGNTVSTTGLQTLYLDADGAHFNVSSDTVAYNDMTFSGEGGVSIANDLPTLTAGITAERPERVMVVLTEQGNNTLDGRGFWMTENISEGITVGAIDNGIGAQHIVPYESFPDDAGKFFAEEALIYGDDDYTVRLDKDGIRSIYGISSGATLRGNAYLEGEIDTLGSIVQFGMDGAGVYTFGNKVYTIAGGPINDSVVVGMQARFYNNGTSSLRAVQYLDGTVSGSFSGAVTINGNSTLDVVGDDTINVIAQESGVQAISGVSNGASVRNAGGATLASTDEEGVFQFRNGNVQNFTISGDSSVDFVLENYTDADGNPTMQVAAVTNLESGTLIINDSTAYFKINSTDELAMVFSDTATFVISDSQIASVSGIEFSINNLKSDTTVHATGSMTVNSAAVNVEGDNDFEVIVTGGTTTGLVNISSGASVSVANMNVTTDENGAFHVGSYDYTINDTVDNSVIFVTNVVNAVDNIANFAGTMQTSAQNVTVNGAALYSSNSGVSIISAGVGIARLEGLVSGDSIGGDLSTTTILIPATTDNDTLSVITINQIGYVLKGDTTGVIVTGKVIDGLDANAAIQIGAAGTYTINSTELTIGVGDTVIGTSEGAAYIYDPNNIPLNISTMTDEEIAAQVGIPSNYTTVETNTIITDTLLRIRGDMLNGNMELLLDNPDSNIGQRAYFNDTTGKKKVTLESGEQNVWFNNVGGNVAVISGDAEGEKNVTLGSGGDLVIIEGTNAPVNVTPGAGKDTIVTAGNDVWVNMGSGATKIVPNSGNVTLNNYDASSNAGIQANEYASIERAILNSDINLGDGQVSFSGSTISVGGGENDDSTTVNLFNNQGVKQKVAYTHSDGGTVDLGGERENLLLIGNNTNNKGNTSSITAGSGNDTAYGGAGDYFDLGAGQNYISLNDDRKVWNDEGATIALTANSGRTEVDGFNFGYGSGNDNIAVDINNAKISFSNGKLTFTNAGGAKLILNSVASSPDLAESADLFTDDNFVGSSTLADISPITYEQGDYLTSFESARETLSSGAEYQLVMSN